MTTEMINNRKSDGEYVKPSCSILSIVEESMIAASPDPPSSQPTPDPSPLGPPSSETDDPNCYAKQHHYYDVWEQW